MRRHPISSPRSCRNRLHSENVHPPIPTSFVIAATLHPSLMNASNIAASTASPDRNTVGFNVIGYVSANLGLGVCARSLIAALLAQNYPVAILDMDPGENRTGSDRRYAHLAVPDWSDLPYDINLVVLPLITADRAVFLGASALDRPERLNVLCVLWELTVLPALWRRTVEYFDVVLALSGFIENTFSNCLSGPFVVPGLCPLDLPPNVNPDRSRFALSDSDVVFVTSLELASDPRRKNPDAVIEAFQRGARGASNARLLVKLNNVQLGVSSSPYLEFLRAKAEGDRRIRILADTLRYQDVIALFNSADAYISLHRAEGLGLTPLEAMALAKPVIATAWSGNMTYMTHSNSCLVPYKLVPVAASVQAYTLQAVSDLTPMWAEPDVSAAANWIARLINDPDLRRHIGARAAASFADYQTTAMQAVYATDLLNILEHRRATSTVPDRASRIKAIMLELQPLPPVVASAPVTRKDGLVTRFRRYVGRALDQRMHY